MIASTSKIEGAPQHAEGIVVGLLAPVTSVGDGDEAGVADSVENLLADLWAPNAVKNLSIRTHRRRCDVLSLKTGFAVGEVFIEDFVAQAEIVEGNRTVIEYLLSPVQRVSSEAATER